MRNEKEEVNSSLMMIAKSSVIVFIGVILSKVFTYIYRIIIARGFGPETYGLFSLAIMFSGFFVLFFSLGLENGLLRYIPFYEGAKKQKKIIFIFRKSFLISLVGGIIGGALLFIFSDWISINLLREEALIPFLKIFSLSVPLSILLALFLSVLRGKEFVGWSSFISNILGTFANVFFISLLIFIGFNSEKVVYLSHFAAVLVTTLVAFVVVFVKVPQIFKKKYNKDGDEKKVFKEFLSYSWPLIFSGILWKTFHWADSFFIGFYMNAKDVGVYNAAVPISLLLVIAFQIFIQLFFPLVSREYASGNKKTVEQISKQVGKWIFMINMPLFILIMVSPDFFLGIFFGSEYLVAGNSLRFLSIGALFFSIFNVSNRLIEMSGRSKLILIDSIIINIINIALNILLIPRYGINGAALATMISLVLLSIIFGLQSKRYLSIVPLRRKMANLVLSLTIATIILVLLYNLVGYSPLSFALLSVLFLAIYIFLSLILKAFDENDLAIIKSAYKKLRFKA